MKTIAVSDLHCLSAASGWLGLGNPAEALAELERVDPQVWQHPDVLEMRWAIFAQRQDWDEGLKIAQALIEVAPERSSAWLHRSYSLRRATGGGVEKAFEALLPASKKFPKEPIVAFNLSCYACQLQRLPEAREWLKRAFKIGRREHIREMALADDDLKPLWAEIRKL